MIGAALVVMGRFGPKAWLCEAMAPRIWTLAIDAQPALFSFLFVSK